MKKYQVSFSGGCDVIATNENEAMEKVTNEMILDSIEFDECQEVDEEREKRIEEKEKGGWKRIVK